jgi:hypothetical protein
MGAAPNLRLFPRGISLVPVVFRARQLDMLADVEGIKLHDCLSQTAPLLGHPFDWFYT